MSFVQQREPMLRDDPTLPSELRAAFAGYGDVTPSSAAREALFLSLERQLPSARRSRLLRAGMWLVGLTLLGVTITGVTWSLQPTAVQQTPAAQRTTVPSENVSRVTVAAVAPPEVAASAPVQARERVREPRIQQRAARTRAESVDPTAELALLTRAKRVLPSDASAALALTREHHDKFLHGTFAQEREVIAIEALVRSGDLQAARSRAATFRLAYPHSTHLERLHVVLAEP